MVPAPDQTAAAEAARAAAGLLKAGKPAEAERLLKAALAGNGVGALPWTLLAKAQQMQSAFGAMAESAATARGIAPGDERLQDLELEALVLKGDIAGARERITGLAWDEDGAPERLGRLAEVAVQIADYELAEHLLQRACAAAPLDPRFRFNLAAAEVALGKLEAAETNLLAAIAARPDDGDAWYNLATLRRQMPERNHVAELEATLARLAGRPGEFAARFALAKELEDLGEHAACFAQLEKGNALRRAGMQYRVEDDVRTMRRIEAVFADDYLAAGEAGFAEAAPIFVTGMPRSGTTLVDRIFASHPEVESVGEVNDLALATMEETGAVASKDALIEASARTAPERIGANYARRMQWRAPAARRTVDKTPLNFLYLGLIARALPKATIVHVRRDPMDIAFAVYKTLFRMGYPFAYSLDDISEYLIAKHRLMAHWRGVLGDRLVEIDYEVLVTEQEPDSRRLLAAAGLPWDSAVLDFHTAQSPSATASAAQVRQPIHSRSVGAWKRHEAQLAGLRKRLDEAGASR